MVELIGAYFLLSTVDSTSWIALQGVRGVFVGVYVYTPSFPDFIFLSFVCVGCVGVCVCVVRGSRGVCVCVRGV